MFDEDSCSRGSVNGHREFVTRRFIVRYSVNGASDMDSANMEDHFQA